MFSVELAPFQSVPLPLSRRNPRNRGCFRRRPEQEGWWLVTVAFEILGEVGLYASLLDHLDIGSIKTGEVGQYHTLEEFFVSFTRKACSEGMVFLDLPP